MSAPPVTRRAFLGIAVALAVSSAGLAGVATLTLEEVVGPLRHGSPLAAWILARCLGEPPRVRLANGEVAFGRFDAAALVRNHPPSALVQAANVLVHEACHYLGPILVAQHDPHAYDRPGSVALVLAPDVVRYVSAQPTFPAREAAPSFPVFLRESQRFATYVDSREESLVTQQYGIFGLLNEFAAYHVGTRAALDLVRDLARRPVGSAMDWVAHLADVDATVLAWPEFRGYILAWLAYARARRPEMYADLVATRALRAGWRGVDQAFGAVCRAWYRDLPAIVLGLQRAGIPIQTRADVLVAGRQGRRLFRREYQAILEGICRTPGLGEIEKALARP